MLGAAVGRAALVASYGRGETLARLEIVAARLEKDLVLQNDGVLHVTAVVVALPSELRVPSRSAGGRIEGVHRVLVIGRRYERQHSRLRVQRKPRDLRRSNAKPLLWKQPHPITVSIPEE